MTSIPHDQARGPRGFVDVDNTADVPGKRARLVLGMDTFGEVTRTVVRPNESKRPPMAWNVMFASAWPWSGPSASP